MTLDELLDRIDRAYPNDLPRDRYLFSNALATAALDRLAWCVDWWTDHHPEKPPTVRDLQWVARTRLDAVRAREHIAEARAVLHGHDRLPLDQEG